MVEHGLDVYAVLVPNLRRLGGNVSVRLQLHSARQSRVYVAASHLHGSL